MCCFHMISSPLILVGLFPPSRYLASPRLAICHATLLTPFIPSPPSFLFLQFSSLIWLVCTALSADGTGPAPSAPSMTHQQTSFAYIRARMNECRQAVQASLDSAIEQYPVLADDSAMRHYLLAVNSLNESQQAAATAVTRLAVAEEALVAFNAAVKLHSPSKAPPAAVSGM